MANPNPISTTYGASEPDYLAITTASQQFTLTLDAGVQFVFVADVDCYIKVAANPTASAADGSQFVPAKVPWPVATATAGDKVAVIGTIAGVSTLSRMVVRL